MSDNVVKDDAAGSSDATGFRGRVPLECLQVLR